MMYERTHFFETLGDREGRIVIPDENGIREFNMMQIQSGRRQIYCCEDKFELVRECAGKLPDLFDGDRPRFQIM